MGLPPERREKALAVAASQRLSRIEWQRIGVVVVLAFAGNIAFWTAFEQAGSSMNVFAAQSTDRTLWGLLDSAFPATWYQAVNPAVVITFAPVLAWLWVFLGRRNLNPSTPMKFAIGLWLLGLAFLAMVFGAMEARDGGLAGPHWLLITFVVYTWGELCLSPVGLSMVTKLAPARLQSMMMGVWFFSFSLSNLLAGLVARYSGTSRVRRVDLPCRGLARVLSLVGRGARGRGCNHLVDLASAPAVDARGRVTLTAILARIVEEPGRRWEARWNTAT